MKKAKTFLINSIILIFTSLITKIICSLFDIYIANKIGAETLGLFSVISSIYLFGITMCSSGINLATTKVISEELEQNTLTNTRHILKFSVVFSLITGIFSCAILCIFAPYISHVILYNKIPKTTIYILALSLPFISLSLSLSSYFLAKRNVLSTSINQIATQGSRMLVIYICLNVFTKDISSSILALVLGTTISEAISLLLHYLVYLYDKSKYKTPSYYNPKNIIKKLLKIALPIAITSYIRSGLHSIKHILVPLRLKLTGMSYEVALSNYGVITGMAIPIIMFGSVFIYSFSTLLIPEFSRYSINNNKKEMTKDIHKLFKFTLYFSIGLTGILMMHGNNIGEIIFYSSSAGHYIKLLAPLIALIYLDNVIDNILKGLGKQVSVMICNIIDMIVSISFIYFLLPKFGSYGYIIVMYISEILNYIISVLTLFRTTNVKFKYFEWVIFPTLCIIVSLLITKLLPIPLILKLSLTLSIYLIFILQFNRKCVILYS